MLTAMLTADDLRTPGERRALLLAVGSMALVMAVLSIGSLGTVLALVAGAFLLGLVQLVVRQSSLRRQALRISPGQLGPIHEIGLRSAQRLDMQAVPMFLVQDSSLNAYASGLFSVECIVLHSALVDSFDERELQFVIGHEMTHLKCAHMFWRILGGSHPALRLPVLSHVGHFFLRWWERKAELTSDRGGLIACQDLEAALRALLKLAVGPNVAKRVDVDEFLRQALGSEDALAQVAGLSSSHPDIPSRIQALRDFSRSSGYVKHAGAAAQAPA